LGTKCKNRFFRAYRRQKWIDLRQAKTKMINGLFCIYRRIHFHQRKCFVLWMW